MSKLKLLQEELETNVKKQEALLDIRNGKAAGIEKRELNEDETAEFELLDGEILRLESEISLEKKFETSSKRNAGMHFEKRESGEKAEKAKISRQFSLLRALNLTANNKPLDGLEREMYDEAVKEARADGRSIDGNVAMPSMLMHVPTAQEMRTDITVGTAATAGNLVATDLYNFIPAFTPRMKAVEMGATVWSGLTGNVDLPIGDALATTAWEGETDTTAETNPTTTKLSLTANRLAAFIDVTKQFLIQSSHGPEMWLRGELSGATARAVDLAILNGSGTSNQPEGILNKTGIGDVAGGTNGLIPTFANIIELETDVATANADIGNLGYLTTPGVRGKLKSVLKAAATSFIWEGNADGINGYRAEVSTQVPSTLTKGTASGICHAIIFGHWPEAILANWGQVDIIVNPYTKAKEGTVELIVNSYWDVGIPRAGAFSAMKDALIS